jgi:beta-phosphoglucomutase-like phosphatase (HAD superfamily)
VLVAEGVTLTERDYYERYLGMTTWGVPRREPERGMHWDAGPIAALVDRAVHLERLERDGAILFPGADQLSGDWGLAALAIASGALRVEILRVLNHAGAVLRRHRRRCDSPAGKPAPDPLARRRSSVSRLRADTAPGECVAVEDSHKPESARTAGLRTIAVTHTYPAGPVPWIS